MAKKVVVELRHTWRGYQAIDVVTVDETVTTWNPEPGCSMRSVWAEEAGKLLAGFYQRGSLVEALSLPGGVALERALRAILE